MLTKHTSVVRIIISLFSILMSLRGELLTKIVQLWRLHLWWLFRSFFTKIWVAKLRVQLSGCGSQGAVYLRVLMVISNWWDCIHNTFAFFNCNLNDTEVLCHAFQNTHIPCMASTRKEKTILTKDIILYQPSTFSCLR